MIVAVTPNAFNGLPLLMSGPLGIIAVVLGIAAFRTIGRRGERGLGMAIAGFGAGILAIALNILLIIILVSALRNFS